MSCLFFISLPAIPFEMESKQQKLQWKEELGKTVKASKERRLGLQDL